MYWVDAVVKGGAIRILAVEDMVADVMLAERELKRAGLTWTLDRVETESDFRRELAGDPDLILCDFKLPQFDGLEALRIARAVAPEVPFIFVSGVLGEELAIEAMKAGATDYVLKNNLARLGPVVSRTLMESQDRRSARQAERRFRDLVHASQDWIWELDVDGLYIFSSPAAGAILGLSPEQILGAHYSAQVHEEDRALMQRALGSLGAKEQRVSSVSARFKHRDGSYRWLERHALALIDERGLITGFRGTDRDVTVRKLQAQRIERLSRIHIMLSSINSAVLRIRDRRELLKEVCRIATTQGGYAAAAILLADAGSETLRIVARAGSRADSFKEFTTTLRTKAQPSSLTQEAVTKGRPAICNDLADPGRYVYGREELLKFGLRAFSAWPLSVDGTVIGALDLGSLEAGAFDEEETALLLQVAGSLSFALQYIEVEGVAEYLTYFDPMTGLARRALFCERVARTLGVAPAYDARELEMLVLDIERLGAINDSYGRHIGDRVLQLISERLKRVVEDPTHLAYLGNGCFGLVVTGVRAPEASTAKIVADLERAFTERLTVDDHKIRISLRVGAALFPADGLTADELLQRAEMAMKSAKASGERYLMYAAGMNTEVLRRMTLDELLRQALDRKEFLLHYQPKLLLDSGRIAGVEALLRWKDATGTLRSPAEFIPALEESGLIVDVGQWVIEQAVADTLDWHARGLPSIPIAVNVSPLQFRRREFVDSLLRATAPLAGIGRHIDIEITESALMTGLESAARALERIAVSGIEIAIDDFGTGHSSLSRLSQLAVKYLKIDRSFITNLDSNPRHAAVVSTILSLASSFNMVAIAEGVETQAELRELSRLRCHQFQGYIAAKPVPAAEFRSLLDASGGVFMDPMSAAADAP